MSKHKFGVGEYLLRDGCKAVILADNMPGKCPLCGYWIDLNGNAYPCSWGSDGTHDDVLTQSPFDLMPHRPWTMEKSGHYVYFYLHGSKMFDFGDWNNVNPEELLKTLNAGEAAE